MAENSNTSDYLVKTFEKSIGQGFKPTKDYVSSLNDLISFCNCNFKTFEILKSNCIKSINQKFEFNKPFIKGFIDFAASKKIYFNYHNKKKIKTYFDSGDKKSFNEFLKQNISDKSSIDYLEKLFCPLSAENTIIELHKILNESTKRQEILNSLFSAYVFNSLPLNLVHSYFSGTGPKEYIPDYYEYLNHGFGESLIREKALSIIVIDNDLIRSFNDIENFKDSIANYIRNTYNSLSNHCHLAIYIDLGIEYVGIKWELYSDIVLYAEKFIEEELNIGYFHPEKIREQTLKHIPEIKIEDSKFEIANGGFNYKDCFILTETNFRNLKIEESLDNYGMLLLFEKNKRDETLIPCPACRSNNVRGNSYPTIGVKSWECNNLLCPEKSKYNRGKRYSLSSIIKQEAIHFEENEIEDSIIKNWQLDLLKKPSRDEIIQFLIKHYSLINDRIELVNYDISNKNLLKREIIKKSFEVVNDGCFVKFYNSCFFKRFEILNSTNKNKKYSNISPLNNHAIYNGDSRFVMNSLKPNSISHAVTSPPYYNAKEYSNWDNIYCYLHDIYNNAIAVYRVLKPGGNYIFNIFDYFDNENNIVFSAMGKKRMILGAYIIYLFKKAGFKLVKNIVWYKGHIQGNRSFNQGNNFPYYQAPLNCYEHVFQFVKPSKKPLILLNDLVNIKPVYKIVKGENILGHSAPFPEGIPNVLVKKMSKNEIILDPYSGSFTTSRVAMNYDIKSVSIELDKKYCELGIRLLKGLNKINL